MEDNETIVVEVNKSKLRDEFAKLVIGTAAGFIASKLAESAYEKFVIKRRGGEPTIKIKND